MSNMKKIDFTKNDFIKNVFTMTSGTVIGYGINTVSLLIISRIYTKTVLGAYDLMVSSASIFITIMMLSLTLVVMLPEEDYEANAICKIMLISNVLGIFIIGSVLLLGYPKIQIFEIDINYKVGIVFFLVYMLTYNVQAIYYSYLNRKKCYRQLFWNPIITATVNSVVSIALSRFGTMGYLFGTISSYIISTCAMAFFVSPFAGKHDIAFLWKILKKYRNYPIVQLPANFVELLALQLPIQFFGHVYSTEILGGYSMACKLLSMPVSLLATPINRVYYRTLIDKIKTNDGIGSYIYKMIKNNLLLISLPISIMMIWGTEIIGFILGREWSVCGEYIAIIGFMYILKFCTTCTGGTFVATNNTKVSLQYAILTLAQYGLCFGICYILKLNYKFVMSIYTINVVVNTFICIALTMKCIGEKTKSIFIFLIRYLIINALVVYGIRWLKGEMF